MSSFGISFALGCIVGFFACVVFGAAAKSVVAQWASSLDAAAASAREPRTVSLTAHSPLVLVVLAAACYTAGLEKTSAMMALLFLVLVIAKLQGSSYGILSSFIAAGAASFFFLPPVGSLRIADPANQLVLVFFLINAIAGSSLFGAKNKAV